MIKKRITLDDNLQLLAKKIRSHILKMVYESQASHVGPCFSAVEILVTLYSKIMNIHPQNYSDKNRDRFLLSKAHASAALYAILAEFGFFPIENLQKYYLNDGILPGHLDKQTSPGIEFSFGSLGHGLPVGVGMALGNRVSKNPGNIFVLLGDGECDEGSIWEAAMFAGQQKLSNITAIVDYNKLQNFGKTNEIINLEPFASKWNSFGWDAHEVDGHNFNELQYVLNKKTNKPKAVIAHTIKGKGVSFMENKLEWHYKSPNKEQYEQALNELLK